MRGTTQYHTGEGCNVLCHCPGHGPSHGHALHHTFVRDRLAGQRLLRTAVLQAPVEGTHARL